jgi:hypothetical protein
MCFYTLGTSVQGFVDGKTSLMDHANLPVESDSLLLAMRSSLQQSSRAHDIHRRLCGREVMVVLIGCLNSPY